MQVTKMGIPRFSLPLYYRNENKEANKSGCEVEKAKGKFQGQAPRLWLSVDECLRHISKPQNNNNTYASLGPNNDNQT